MSGWVGVRGYNGYVPRLRKVSPRDPDGPGDALGRVRLPGRVRKPPDLEERQRCQLLVIPPAWEQVWICPVPNGHLQAVGTDDAGRRQYLYHEQWRVKRDRLKYDRVLEVAARLPQRGARSPGIAAGRNAVPAGLGTAFRLLDLGFFRIGGEAYAEANNSYDLQRSTRSTSPSRLAP